MKSVVVLTMEQSAKANTLETNWHVVIEKSAKQIATVRHVDSSGMKP